MAWIKIPKEHHPIFLELLPSDPRIETKAMFGAIAAMVNGRMMGGLFAHSMIVRLAQTDYARAVALGAEPFDPMGKGAVMTETLLLPESEFRDRRKARAWLEKALAHALSLPPKPKKPSAKATETPTATAPTKKAPPKKAPPKKVAAKKASPKKKAPAKR